MGRKWINMGEHYFIGNRTQDTLQVFDSKVLNMIDVLILTSVNHKPGSGAMEIVIDLKSSKKTINRHLARLERDGLLIGDYSQIIKNGQRFTVSQVN